MKTSFRKASTKDIQDYRCNFVRERPRKFLQKFGKEVNRFCFIYDQESVTVESKTGLIYCRDGREYAMGVCMLPGEYIIDNEFFIDIEIKADYVMYGPYYPVGWTAGEIEKALVWRSNLIRKPIRIDKNLVEKFEKSRWILRCFWPKPIAELVTLELDLLDKIIQEDDMIGGGLRHYLLQLHNLSSMEALKEHIKKQIETFRFTLTEKEDEFVRYVAGFHEQVRCIFNI